MSGEFAFQETISCCVNNLCISCLYKIFPSGTIDDDKSFAFPPNIRPELCPRIKSNTLNFNSLFRRDSSILTVGDGDLSYSLSLSRFLKSKSEYEADKCSIFATTHESFDSIISTYPTSSENIKSLRTLGSTVLHQVDATNLTLTKEIRNLKFDFIVWNFPCIAVSNAGDDGQTTQLQENINLLRKFFTSIKDFLRKPSEIHVTHKTIEPFSWWDIEGIADSCGFECVGKVVFDRCCLPGYINRKALDKKSFPSNDARTYVFTAKPDEGEKEKKMLNSIEIALSNNVIKLINQTEIITSIKFAIKKIKSNLLKKGKSNKRKNEKSKILKANKSSKKTKF